MKSRMFVIMTIITPISVAWLMAYLVGSFVCASWNIIDWTQEARFLTAIWGCTFGGAVWYRLEKFHDVV